MFTLRWAVTPAAACHSISECTLNNNKYIIIHPHVFSSYLRQVNINFWMKKVNARTSAWTITTSSRCAAGLWRIQYSCREICEVLEVFVLYSHSHLKAMRVVFTTGFNESHEKTKIKDKIILNAINVSVPKA